MSMSKKHYVAVADSLNKVLWTPHTDPATLSLVIASLADVFAADNSLFDRKRFYEACLRDSNTVLQPGWDAYKAERERLGL